MLQGEIRCHYCNHITLTARRFEFPQPAKQGWECLTETPPPPYAGHLSG